MEIENEKSKNRMVLLLRNSSKKQAEKKITEDGKIEYDIPLQRSILTPWAERMGYTIVKELVEGGISGFKISAEKRDAVIELKAMADRREFDVLGIYMSDRLGRIADETPLIVSYLNARGIRVLSYTDGEISSKTHDEKLMTYIRYWQAEGESIKTSKRIKDAHGQAVEQGKWRGGHPPYGYRTVSKGTLNGKGRPIFDVEIDPEAAEVVRTIFRLYREHYAFKGIAKYLNDNEIPTTTGVLWSWTQIEDILHNKLYIGIYELGKKAKKIRAVSPIMPHLVIISEEEFYEVQELIKKNTKVPKRSRPTIRGSSLLSGLLYCECGRKYTSQSYRRLKKLKDGSTRIYELHTYRCGAYRTPKAGQCYKLPIKAEILDNLVVRDAKNFMTTTDFEKLLHSNDDSVHEKEVILSEQLKRISKEKTQLEKELHKLSEEVCKVIMGESQWSQSVLSKLIETKEQELSDIVKKQEEIESKLKELAAYLAERKANLSELNNWAERFDIQDTPAKKTMLINAIDRITVYDDKVTVKYKFKCDYLRGGTKFDISNDKTVGEVPLGVFPCLAVVQGMSQPSRERLSSSVPRRKIPMPP